MANVRETTDAEAEAAGWAAWSRDDQGLLCSAHAPFGTKKEHVDFVRESAKLGYKVIYPSGPLKFAKGK